jgi:hypothetical protein
MQSDFFYLIDKIRNAPFCDEPFRHIEIRQFLSPEHFEAVTSDRQVALPRVGTTEDLIQSLDDHGYKIIPFPGCVTSSKEYLKWFNDGTGRQIHGATESFGIAFRLSDPKSTVLSELNAFLVSDEMQAALIDKFGIERPVTIDAGLQKYLHGYEISPHPDIRRKALTWMLNINPGQDSEAAVIHTHYLRLKDSWSFVSEFWKGNGDLDRDWLPWDWCETVKQQTDNNSIIIFSPSNDTLHAVKADYDHLKFQRTQMYGNLWYEENKIPKVPYTDFDISSKIKKRHQRQRERAAPIDRFKATPLGQTVIVVKNAVLGKSVDTVRKV